MSNQPTAANPTPPWGTGPYSIKRHGTTLATCVSEPVHTAGCIQAHGALLVLRLGDLKILQASENTLQHLGVDAEKLLGQPIEQIVGPNAKVRLQEMLLTEAPGAGAAYAFTMPAGIGTVAMDACVHTNDGVVILEFESTGRLDVHPDGNFFMRVKSAVFRLNAASNVRGFCQQIAEEVRSITGLDRVMVYRFHPDMHGEVIAESKNETLESWLGLHYPATDIPQQARDIYKVLWIRPLPDAASPLVELLPLTNPDTGRPLNMTYCALRGASVMYTEYLTNMGAAASLTMPILRDGELWGLIACQHNSPTQFSYQVRAACELLAQVASLQLKSAEHAEQLAYSLKMEDVHRQLVTRSARDGDVLALTAYEPSLLDAIDAGGAALYHLDRWWCVGRVPDPAQLDSLAHWLYQQPAFDSASSPVVVTDALASVCPAGVGMEEIASDVLAIALSRHRRGLLVWFRPETSQTVNWAGNPGDKAPTSGPHGARLTPRVSFELFVESVRGRALPWLSIEIDAALRLRQMVMDRIISRGERLEDLNAELTRSNEELDAFAYVASHDLKEPLRGIHRYAHQLLQSAIATDSDSHQRLENLMRLTVRMDRLLDSLLHFSQVGRMELEIESVDLNVVVAEAVEMVGAQRPSSNCSITISRSLPVARCDPLRVREIYSNLLSNAMKYKQGERSRIELGYIAPGEQADRPNAPDDAARQFIFYVKDDGLGIEVRHFDQVFRLFKRIHGRDDYGGGVGAGLTIVQKLVQRHGGHVWLDSKIGVGSTFYFTLSSLQMDTQ